MNFNNIARDLIDAVDGNVSKENIEGVIKVFEGIVKDCDNKWESYIASETEDMLMYDEILCECGRLIQICRYRDSVTGHISDLPEEHA